jgi:anti-sigma B factor antagonist
MAEQLPPPFSLRLHPDRERLVVTPTGELDIETADRLTAAMHEPLDNGFRHVVADLRGVTFIDSSGIRSLWEAHQRAERDGARLSVIIGNGHVRRALALTGLLDRMWQLER